MKKIVSVLLAVVMVLGMSVTAAAADNTHKITITNPKEGHEYAVYQVFSGDLYVKDGVKTLSNIAWGSGVNGQALLTALQGEASFNGAFASAVTAADVAKAMANFDDAKMDKFAEVVGANLSNVTAATMTTSILADGLYEYSATVTEDGYYFVKNTKVPANTTNPDGSVSGNAETRYILQVVGDVTVKAKADAPEIDKNIIGAQPICGMEEGEGHTHDRLECYKVKYNNAALGDTVPFVVDSRVPNMNGYEKYYFVAKDTLSAGLTFDGNVTVKVGNTTLTNAGFGASEQDPLPTNTFYLRLTDKDGNAITVPANATDEQMAAIYAEVRSFEIVFENFIQYKDQADEAIVIEYSATVNKDVSFELTGNPNEVDLKFSNNPNTRDDGTPGEPDYPGPDSPTGETPKSETITYVTGLQLQKVDADDPENLKPLAGAEFTIVAKTLNKVLVNETKFEERAAGDTAGDVYYLLKEGTYTTTAPIFEGTVKTPAEGVEGEDGYVPAVLYTAEEATSKYYDNINGNTVTKTYKLISVTDEVRDSEDITVGEGEDAEETKSYTSYVDANGYLNLKGLPAGTYEITEIKAPNGFNKLTSPIVIEIDWQKPVDGSRECTWTVKKDGVEIETTGKVDNDTLYLFQVENKSGAILPSTGGIGTTIFYVGGSILVLAAVVLLVTKKRMSREK